MNRWPLKGVLVAASLIGGPLFSPLVEAADDAVVESRPPAENNAGDAKWSIRQPQEGPVVYRGAANFDGAGTGSGSMMYAAPNAGGFIAAVITHGLLVDAAKKEQKNQIQAAADKVLLPYKPVLDTFSTRDLMRRAVAKTSTGASAKFIDDAADHSRETVIESTPVFSLTPDQTAIILDNTIVIRMPGSSPASSYHNTVRVISKAKEVSDPAIFWTGSNGEKLKDESARLVASSLDIAFRDAIAGAGSDNASFRTIRYREGTAEKIERAQVLDSHCGQLLVRTLRGNLMSVPTSKSAETTPSAEQCPPDNMSAELSKGRQ